MSKESEIINVRLPDELILELDRLVEKKFFKSRSEAIRDFARKYVQQQELHEKIAKQTGREGGR